jgi:hypothetical protein
MATWECLPGDVIRCIALAVPCVTFRASLASVNSQCYKSVGPTWENWSHLEYSSARRDANLKRLKGFIREVLTKAPLKDGGVQTLVLRCPVLIDPSSKDAESVLCSLSGLLKDATGLRRLVLDFKALYGYIIPPGILDFIPKSTVNAHVALAEDLICLAGRGSLRHLEMTRCVVPYDFDDKLSKKLGKNFSYVLLQNCLRDVPTFFLFDSYLQPLPLTEFGCKHQIT